MSASLSAQALSYAYGKREALKEVSLELKPGHFHVLLGPNGAGKSTLFGLLTGLLKIQKGALVLNSISLNRSRVPLLKCLGVVFQQSTLDLDLSVRQNLRYQGALHGIPRKQIDQRIDEELDYFGLTDRCSDPVRQLNGGHRRRVELARALLHQPSVLLLDEPTVGLDSQTRYLLSQRVRERCRSEGVSVLWATHLMEEVDREDPVTLIHRGQVLFSGRADQMIEEAGVESVAEAFNKLTGFEGREGV